MPITYIKITQKVKYIREVYQLNNIGHILIIEVGY